MCLCTSQVKSLPHPRALAGESGDFHFKFTTFSFPGRRGMHFLSPLRLPERGIDGDSWLTYFFFKILSTEQMSTGGGVHHSFLPRPVTGDFTGFKLSKKWMPRLCPRGEGTGGFTWLVHYISSGKKWMKESKDSIFGEIVPAVYAERMKKVRWPKSCKKWTRVENKQANS